jgi:hypothetical protein
MPLRAKRWTELRSPVSRRDHRIGGGTPAGVTASPQSKPVTKPSCRNADRAIRGIRTKVENSGRRASAYLEPTPVAAFVRGHPKRIPAPCEKELSAPLRSSELLRLSASPPLTAPFRNPAARTLHFDARVSSGDRVDRSTPPRSRQVALRVARRTGIRRRLRPSRHRREADRALQRRSRASAG